MTDAHSCDGRGGSKHIPVQRRIRNQPICLVYGFTGGRRCMQPVDIYYSSSSITAPPHSLLASYLQSAHMAQHYSTQCFAACKTFTLITNQQIYFCKVGAERSKSKKNRGMEAKFYRAVFVVLNFSETRWQACFSEVNITSSERARGQIFSSTNDAHQREGAGRMTHALRSKSSERRPAS